MTGMSKSDALPKNLYDEAILRLVAGAQSGAYPKYVSICDTSQTPKERSQPPEIYMAGGISRLAKVPKAEFTMT